MIFLKGLLYTYDKNIDQSSNNEYYKSAKKGYKFTSMAHIYEKDKKFYKYNDVISKFVEIKLDSI